MRESIFHIANDPAKYRPAMTNTFRITIPGLEGAADITNEEEGATLGEDTAVVLRVSNENFQEPTLNQGTVQIKRENLTIEFPGQMDAFSSTSSFTCFIDADTYGRLYAWKCQAGNHETGVVGDPQDYWKTVTVEHLTGKGELIGTWTLYNCWISQLSGATFDNNSAQVKQVQITLRYFRPAWRKA